LTSDAEILNADELLLPVVHLRDISETIWDIQHLNSRLGWWTPWLTCRGRLYNFTCCPPVYGRFCAVPYRWFGKILGRLYRHSTGPKPFQGPNFFVACNT
jgi:hypothetical protein